MRNTLLTCIDRFRHDRHERLVLGSVLLILAVIVSLTVYWQLRYIGITMTNETFCGYEEHVHIEECYDEEGNLICGLEEHTHTVDCLINLNADVEDSDAWKATLPTLTQNLKTDIINIAYSQLGYTESTANYSIGDDGETHYGYTRYGAWYGNEYGTWDAMFVSFCLNYAGVDRTVFPFGSGAYSWATSLAELGYYSEASGYTPASGDLIFFDTDSDGRIDRVGIVVAVDETSATVSVIEGDYSSGESDIVALNTYYYLTDTTISGYGILPISEETEEVVPEETYEETEEADEKEVVVVNDITYTASDSGVTVTVVAPEGALPDGAILSVSLLDEESEEYAVAAEAVGYEEDSGIAVISDDNDTDSEDAEEISTALAVLDISFTVDGEAVEPTEAVTIIIDASSLMTDDADTSTLEVQHLEEAEEGITPVLVADSTDETTGTIDTETAVVEFTTESFSTFTIRWSYTNNRGQTQYTDYYDVWVYESGTTNEISSTTNTYTYSSSVTVNGTTVTASGTTDLTELLTISGYEFDYAYISYTYQGQGMFGGTQTGTVNNATSITYSNDMGGRYTFVSSTEGTTNVSGVQSISITIYLYYKVSSASITINKYETNTSTRLSGATFTLTNDTNSLSSVNHSGEYNDLALGDTITFTTSEDGSITFSDLPDGNYTLTETSAPTGYDVASGSFTFTVSGNSISTTASGNYSYDDDSSTVTVYDAPSTVELTLEKVYTDASGKVISASDSSVFTLTRTSATSYSSESDQTVTFSGAGTGSLTCRYGSTYTLSETTAPSGYEDIGTITISVDSSTGEVSVTGSDYASVSGNTVTVTNKALTEVTVSKTYLNADGSEMSDSSETAVFTVTDTSGTEVGTVTITGTGTSTISLSSGIYYTISETTVPDGYTASDDVTFTIEDGVVKVNGAAVAQNTVSFTNTAKTTLTIEKVYVDANGNKLSSTVSSLEAEFTVTDDSNNTVGSVTITGSGTDSSIYLTNGTYTLTESDVPTGYASSDVTFTVTNGVITVDGDEVDSITVTNEPDTTNYPLAGMSYAIVAFGNNHYSALTSDSYNTNQGLTGVSIAIGGTSSDGTTLVYSTSGDDVTIWTFIAASEPGTYYITDGNGNYLDITGNNSGGVSTSTTPVALNVDVNTDGTVMIYTSSGALNSYDASRFDGWYYDTADPNEQLTLCLIYQEDGVSITDNISANGTLVAKLVVGGLEVDLTDPDCGCTVVWSKAAPVDDDDDLVYENSYVYEYVTDEDVLFYNNTAVNVALDDGGLYYYKAEVYDSSGSYVGEAVMWVPYADEIMNSSFEYPVGGGSGYNLEDDDVPFWSTTSSDGYMEIAKYSDSMTSYGTQYIYAGGSQAGAGNQFAELNANTEGSLYQDVLTIPEQNLYWSLYHRARTAAGGGNTYDATDTMYVVIMSEEDAQKVLDYADSSTSTQQEVLTAMISYILESGTKIDGSTNATDNATGTYELPNGEIVTVNVWKLKTTTSADGEWTYYYGNYTIPEEQYLTRFFFVSGETEYSNGYSVGNLIDNANFSQEISYVIEYWLWDSTNKEWVLDTTYTESGSVENGTNVYASNLDKFPDYGLFGSVTGTSSGGSDPVFDTNTTTAMRVKGGTTTYLSLYLYKPIVTVVKVVDGLTETQIDEYLDEGNTYTADFTITSTTNTASSETLNITVGETGSGSKFTAEPDYTASGSYTIYETVSDDTITLDGVDYLLSSVTVTVDGVEVLVNNDGTYTYTLNGEDSVTITFTNTYAEAVPYSGLEMPQTGGRGTKLYTMVGILLICSGGYLLYRLKLQRQLKQQKRKCRWRWNI
ncbi:MAG: CHAP domain-containing protein [Oscillospiraceae bacterium]|nr:CHAP domain-containing protein [Oscillospiraceae bacterium]